MELKTIDKSRTEMSHMMLPSQANLAGNVHGGEIMKLMDNAAYVVARKHSHNNIVTARVDELIFHLPIYVGDLVTVKSHLVYVGRTSMEVFVEVEVDDLDNDLPAQKALSAYFTMVSLDKKGNPLPVPKLNLISVREKALFEEGRKRYEDYKKRRQ